MIIRDSRDMISFGIPRGWMNSIRLLDDVSMRTQGYSYEFYRYDIFPISLCNESGINQRSAEFLFYYVDFGSADMRVIYTLISA